MNIRFNLLQPVSRKVGKYIGKHFEPQMKALDNFAHENIGHDLNRMQHLVHVARRGEVIASLAGLSVAARARAYVSGIIHDSVRLEDVNDPGRNQELMKQLLHYAEDYHIKTEKEDVQHPYHLHGRVAAKFAKDIGLPKKTRLGPKYHTPGMPLDKERMPLSAALLIVADKSSFDRDPSQIQRINGILNQDNYGRTSIFLAALYVMLKNLKKQVEKKEPDHPYVEHTVNVLQKQLGLDSKSWNKLSIKEKKEKIKNGEALAIIKSKMLKKAA